MTGSVAPSRRLGFFGVLGTGNVGNDGTLDAVIGYLRERHPDVTFDFLAMGPAELTARYDAPATHLQWYEAHRDELPGIPDPILKIVGRLLDPIRTLRWVRRQDVVLVPGMGVLESTVPIRPWGLPLALLALGASARLTGRDVLLVSVGADLIGKRISRWMITRSARWARYRSYRDVHSRRAMATMGVDVSGDEVYPDLAFRHPAPPWCPDGTGAVGLGLMDYRGDNDERDRAARLHESYVAAMERFALWLVDHGRPLRLLTFDPADTTVVARVADHVRRARPNLAPGMVTPEPVQDLRCQMELMATLDAVVATRYHNVVGAVQVAVPTLAVGYSTKHQILMQRMGLGAFFRPARAVDIEWLVEQFVLLESGRAELVAAMAEHNRENVAGVERQMTTLSALISVDDVAAAAEAGRLPLSSRCRDAR